MLDKLTKLLLRAVGCTFAPSPKPSSHCYIAASQSLFKYCFVRCSSELTALPPLKRFVNSFLN